ncbi:PP2C family protein-serine/threonine phosphatase [Blastococcus deserti]|uniref:PP2C family protein-serine/threonine phosphatase n=1 Tax=Blastococcus deserti TaxID=2259033 RepID=A0ABW4X6U8_9ACTN
MTTWTPDSSGDPLRSLLRASHHLPAHRLGTVVAEHARELGARDAVVYLADYEQHHLMPVRGDGVPDREPLPVDSSVGGLAFRRVEVTRPPRPDAGDSRLWVPLLDGAERAGVLEVVYDHEPTDSDEELARSFASLVAELTVTRDAYSDVFSRLRRSRPMSVAAEIQWELLPPLTFGSERIVISAALEPSYEIGGDTFDYAVNGSTAELLVLDAVGHGLPAALLATAAVGAYRNGRREGLDLAGMSALMNQVIADQFPASRFATALLARLDLDTGRLTWVNAGHPAPLIVRDIGLLLPHTCPSSRPLGLQDRPAVECHLQLQPGDRVLLYTDGIVEARSPAGEFFGEERLADFVVRAEAAGHPPPEMLRRLMRSVMDHQAGRLQDDASIVVVEWRTGRDDQLIL